MAPQRQGPSSQKSQQTTVFISYAREDTNAAKKLYKELKEAGLNP
ncbi:MAG: toll/interleukin-1 receptor domain-containing protein [Thermoproteota archaeon]|nr:toll/interleukin-1 receptor domain-containing protein [Thermoproteota archaeon]